MGPLLTSLCKESDAVVRLHWDVHSEQVCSVDEKGGDKRL